MCICMTDSLCYKAETNTPLYSNYTPIKMFKKKYLYRQAKAKRIQHHQTSFTTNDKGTSLGRKRKRRKRPTVTNPKQLRKW